MFAIRLNGLYWTGSGFGVVPLRFPTVAEATEAAQEDAGLAWDALWDVVTL